MSKRLPNSFTGIACFLLLLLAAGAANAEVIRCTDHKGFITYTDAPCTADMLGVQAPLLTAVQPAGRILVGSGKLAATDRANRAAVPGAISRKNVSPDERTMLGAKAYTDSSDIHLALAREHAAAERALHRNRWAFWRL